ncbi:MAG TPA: alkaline phosphatase [Blastocatellia bacterium]|nr:alkaline phosphatase [Blastocatellia bacterium]
MKNRSDLNRSHSLTNHQLVSRRGFLFGATALSGLALTGQFSTPAQARTPKFAGEPFTLGVASGDPLPDGVVLWTSLAPDPLNGGGMTPEPVIVKWEIAADEQMRKIVKRGAALACAEFGHSVHVEVQGLKPARWYWYRFTAGSAVSPVGRTRTAPALRGCADRFAFAFASCQHYEQGLYTAYQHLAEEDLDLVVHLGDYIYEGGIATGRPRAHNSPEIMTLDDYRNRHALYKGDSHLQRAHALFPWIVTWDDHEVENNYANNISENNDPPETFLERRANAYQAYYEHMPLRQRQLPHGPDLRLYRRVQFGELVQFNVLDTRQYRTDQPCGDGTKLICDGVLNPEATMMGAEQEEWLFRSLDKSKARWNVIAQQVMMGIYDSAAGPDKRISMDQWGAYPAALYRLMNFLGERRPSNPVVITGDIHSSWVNDLKTNFDDPTSAVVGTEFVGTSISSGGDGADTSATVQQQLSENPQIKFYNGRRGYVRCNLTPQQYQADYRIVPAVTRPDEAVSTVASFVVTNGTPGAVRTS